MAPEAVMAIHDATYSTRPRTYSELRWRLRYLFEERVGRRISENAVRQEAEEEAAMARLREVAI